MASRIETFDVVVPGQTAIATPQTTALDFDMGVVQRIEILIPPGPSGLVGFRIMHSGRSVIPYDTSKWVVADDEVIKWDTENYPVGSAWALQAYNLDAYDHTLYLRFLVIETARALTASIPILDIQPVSPAELEPATGEEF
jgi:hypothetical protein